MKYMKKLKARAKKKLHETVQVRAQDVERAGKLIIHTGQFKAFKDQLKEPAKGKEDSSTPMTTKLYNPVRKLDPYIDEDGVLRVGGRLKNADYADQVKHPIILPKGSHVTKLIIKHYHECTKQQGKRMMLNEIWSRGYWIMGGSSAVSTLIASCVTCRKLRGPVIQQRMADLPEDRLESVPPFTYCAAHYFGPFMVKEKRKEIKRYGVIFTCMASRAIHLESANSLDTDSFLNAFRQFTSRRGPVRQLGSDQRTNFVGA